MHDYDPLRVPEQVFVTGCDNTLSRTAPPCVAPPPAPLQDWHRADIIAAIRKTGTTLSALSRQHGLSSITLANVLARKWSRAERIIADHLGVPPWVIWPSRYPRKCPFPTGQAVAEPDDAGRAQLIFPDKTDCNLLQRE